MKADVQNADIEAIYSRALELEPGPARDRYLDDACRDNPPLRQRIEKLLAARSQRGQFLDSAACANTWLHQLPPAELPGSSVGPYRLLEEIGIGGMGVVYMAEQTTPVRRRVALKIIKPGMDTREIVARFEAERQALSLMDHPHIARVFDAGATDGGRPFFVMELVHGIAITDYCDRERLSIPDRLKLLIHVCRAVQHAHTKGIIHRDLKASNVLVTVVDGAPVPKVIDFGIAKATGAALTDRTLFTGFHQFIGTPAYMSPEQAELSGVDVDTRSDVYSLGVLLYELLTGTTPVDAATLRQAPWDEIRRRIREQEPPRPSTRVSTLSDSLQSTASARRSSPQQLRLTIRGELDWIVMKCLEIDRSRRYESPTALALDLERYLNLEPVEAHPPSPLYRLRKLARKRRGTFLAITLIALSLLAGTAVSTYLAVVAGQRAEGEILARRQAESNLRRGHEAVELLLTRVAMERLLDEPRLESLRKDLLADALKLNQTLLLDNPQDLEARFETAKAYRRMADIHDHLGDPNQSANAARQAIHILDSLATDSPDESRFQVEMAKSYRILSIGLFNGANGSEDSSAVHRQVLTLYEKLAQSSPGNADFQLGVAGACNLVAFNIQSIDAAESDSLFSRSLDLANDLTKRFPDRLDFAEHNARTHWFWGRALSRRQDLPRAHEQLTLAVNLSTDLLAKAPRSAAYRKSHIEALTSLAQVCLAQSKPDDGLGHARQAQTLAADLVRDYPTNEKFHSMYINASTAVLCGLQLDNRLDEALTERRRLDDFARQHLESRDGKLFRAQNLAQIGRLENSAGNHHAAAAALREAASLHPGSEETGAVAAVAYNYCVKQAHCDSRLSREEKQQAIDRYVALARDTSNLSFWTRRYRDNPNDTDLLLLVANLQAWLGSADELEQTCRLALETAAGTQDPVTAERTAKACSIRGLKDQSLRNQALLLARQAVKLGANQDGTGYRQFALGMAEFRCDNWEASRIALEAALKSDVPPEIRTAASFYKAMCLYRLNRADEARHILKGIQESDAKAPPQSRSITTRSPPGWPSWKPPISSGNPLPAILPLPSQPSSRALPRRHPLLGSLKSSPASHPLRPAPPSIARLHPSKTTAPSRPSTGFCSPSGLSRLKLPPSPPPHSPTTPRQAP